MSQMVVFGVSFWGIVDHAKMTVGFFKYLREAPIKLTILVSSEVKIIKVEILGALVDIIIDRY